MKSKRISFLILSFVYIAFTSLAAIRTPYQALKQFNDYNLAQSLQIPSVSKLDLVCTLSSKGSPSLYVYSNKETNKGFVILSANEKNNVLVGYSPNSSIEPSKIPEALKFLIENNRHQTPIYRSTDRKAIAPMLNTKWSQTAPYNNTQPTLNEEHCAVGCIGTAIGQLIKFHRYPTQPVGTVNFYWSGNMKDYSVDFSEYKFDFDNMIDDYNNGIPTDNQIKAVNDLLYCCSAAVESNWGISLTTAHSELIPGKMKTHFNYSENAGLVSSKCFTISEWSDIMYSQLEKGLPVIISANRGSSNVGHAFICDGYDRNEYFHINWGWGGNFDGFFNISSLYTFYPDVDYSAEGYGTDQEAVINLYPKEMDIIPQVIYTCNDFQISENNNGTLSVNCGVIKQEAGPLLYLNGNHLNAKFGLKFTEVTNNKILYVEGGYDSYYGSGWWNQDYPKIIEDGIYKVTPAVYLSDTDSWQDIYANLQYRKYLANVSDNKVSIFKSTEQECLKAKNTEYPEVIFYEKGFSAYTELVNNSNLDIIADIMLCVCSKKDDGTLIIENKYTNRGYLNVKVESGETRSINLSYNEGFHFNEEMYICFMQYNNYEWIPISEPMQIPVVEYSPGQLVLDEISIHKYPEQTNPTLTINAVLHCEGGYYNGEILMDLVECDENGNIIDPETHLNCMSVLSTETGYGDTNNNNCKLPQSPTVIIAQKNTSVHISIQQNNEIKVITSITNPNPNPDPDPNPDPNPKPKPIKILTPVLYSGGGDNELVMLLSGMLIGAWMWNTLDVPEIPVENIEKWNYYNIDGKALPSRPSAPGLYIMTSKNHDVKAKKIIIP